jgi:tetratricopeptide (TPR) repeat protein
MRAVIAIASVASLAWCGCQRQRQEDLFSADGRAAYQRGLAALQAKQWDLAIKHFREIEMGQRPYPPLLRALGLAYAGAGHEAVAVAWLQAYVVADPRASDAPAMRAELGRVEAAGQGKVRDLLEQALAAIESLPDELAKDRELWVLAHFTASAGDITRALEIERRKRGERASPPNEAGLWADYAQGLALEEGRTDNAGTSADFTVVKLRGSDGQLYRPGKGKGSRP